jgi:hypothetical protein
MKQMNLSDCLADGVFDCFLSANKKNFLIKLYDNGLFVDARLLKYILFKTVLNGLSVMCYNHSKKRKIHLLVVQLWC